MTHSKSILPSRLCLDCSADISDRHFNAKRCHECSATYAKVRRQEKHQERWANTEFRDAENERRRTRKQERMHDPVYVVSERKRNNEWTRLKRWNDSIWREKINARLRVIYHQIKASPERNQAMLSAHRAISLRWYRRNGTRSEIVEQRNSLRRKRYATDQHYRRRQLDTHRTRHKWDTTVNRESVAALLTRQRARCADCRKSIRQGYHLDHILPLAQGGQSTLANLQLLCAKCNSSKGARLGIIRRTAGKARWHSVYKAV